MKNIPKQEICTVLRPIFTPKQDFFEELALVSGWQI